MTRLIPDYRDFDEYEQARLEDKSPLEQLLIMDSELANYTHLDRYIGPIHQVDLPFMYSAYDEQFSAFIEERLSGLIDDPSRYANRTGFSNFREGIAELNKTLAWNQNTSIDALSESAERLLTKRLRRAGLDPTQMELDHMNRDGALYVLELYATAAQQELFGETDLLTELQTAIDEYRAQDYEDLVNSLRYPVLMVTLWRNQRKGLEEWLESGRRGVLEMATATGKTVAGIGAIAHLCGVVPNHDFDVWDADARTSDASIAVVAHSNAILSQWEREIRELLGLNVSGADRSGQPDELSFATGTIDFHTIHSLLPMHGGAPNKTYDLVICDEAHHYANTSEEGFGGTLKSIRTKSMLGLSATLGRDGSKKRGEIESLLGDVVYSYTVEDAQQDGIIPDFEWTVHPTAFEASEKQEWEKKTNRITNLFKRVRYNPESKQILRNLGVPFTEFRDLGDFIRAHKTASIERDSVPDSWQNLHAAIMSRNMIRHRSRPKLDAAIDLAEDYLTAEGDGIKLVMFAMNIDTTEEIGRRLRAATGEENVFVVHSKVESSNKKKDETVRNRIDQFKSADNGVLIAPKLLDEGIDVPDAEIGINVAGTKTELQLIQRMGRVLRRYGDQRPHFHHYVAVPDEQHLNGVDGKEFAKQLYWVRELGERIGQQPAFEPAAVDEEVVERAKRRGNELWAEELMDEEAVETIDGPLDLKEILSSLTIDAIDVLLERVKFDRSRLSEQEWEHGMKSLRAESLLAPGAVQQLWWLYPIYQDDPSHLKQLLSAAREQQTSTFIESTTPSHEPGTGGKDGGSGSGSRGQGAGPSRIGASGRPKTEVDHGLTDHDLRRLHDIAALEPTKNAELCSKWGYDSGSDLYGYLRRSLLEYFERNSNGKIVLNATGKEIVTATDRPSE